MSQAVKNVLTALQSALQERPAVGGFPYLAERLRAAGINRNIWMLPSCQSLYLTEHGPVVSQGTPLIADIADVPRFDQEALIRALRLDQAGKSTFPEFLLAAWKAGVVRYEVDFIQRQVTYYGCDDQAYVESYPAVA